MMKDRDLIIGEFRSQLVEIVKSRNPAESDYLLYAKCHRFLRYHGDDKVRRAMAEAYLDTLVAKEIQRSRRTGEAARLRAEPRSEEEQ